MSTNTPFSHRIYLWINAWIGIVCNIINIITFTTYRPWWDFTHMSWWHKKQMIKRMRQFKIENNK